MLDKFLLKLNRFSAWVLLVLIILFIISGYGMTKQIIDPIFASYLHNILLPIPLFIFFLLHVALSTRRVLGDVYILVISLVLLVLFFWLYLS